MPFFADTDNDGAGWDNALDKAVVGGAAVAGTVGAGIAGLGGLLALTGGAEAATIFGAPLGISQMALGGVMAGVGGTMVAGAGGAAAVAQMGIPGDIVHALVGDAQGIDDFFTGTKTAPGTPAGPPSLADVLGQD